MKTSWLGERFWWDIVPVDGAKINEEQKVVIT